MRSDPRGALWHKWDLHVHTPASIIHQYPGGSEEVWEAFLSDLESLPDEVKVIGINDYLFIEGYERLLRERANGRLSNIDLVLPVVELRLDIFGGTESRLSRANYHVIFSDDVEPGVIRDQFISALASEFQLVPKHVGTDVQTAWSGALNQAALENLGQAIIESVSNAERKKYGSAKIEGFNNLTVSLEKVQECIRSSFFRHSAITAVGLTEWSDIKWKDGSIADKKNVINSADCVFVSSESPTAYHQSRQHLIEGEVNTRLIDCSDAHHLSSSDEKDRIGNSFSWIKADRTFGGLLQALQEFENRVFIGSEPPQLARLRGHPSRYLDKLTVSKKSDSSLDATWFEVDLPLNSGLVAIIGNKGSGKSALAEILGVTCASDREEHFSFLTKTKFRDSRQNLASEFIAEATWLNQQKSRVGLSDDPLDQEPLVQHLPQQYLEQLCTEIPRGGKTEFDDQLERIIFSHLPPEERLGADSLTDLVEMLERPLQTQLEEDRKELAKTNRKIAGLEVTLTASERARRKEIYHRRRREWWELRNSPPEAVEPPSEDDPDRIQTQARLRELSIAKHHITAMKDATQSALAALRRDQSDFEAFRSAVESLQRDHSSLMNDSKALLERLGLPPDVSQFTIETPALDAVREDLAGHEGDLARQLGDEERSLPSAISWIEKRSKELQGELSGPAEEYESYLEDRERWEKEVSELLGTREDPATLLGARDRLMELRSLPAELESLRLKRLKEARQIHAILVIQAQEHAALYHPLEAFMAERDIPAEYRLSVRTGLVDSGFAETFLETMVNRNAAGSYCGIQESLAVVTELLDQTDLDEPDDVADLASALTVRLHQDFRSASRPATDITAQLRKDVKPKDVYDFIFGLEYLSTRFSLEFGGKPIYRLSPGEKGTLLLIFFLLADLDHKPLIVDQPEDNLDNNTVYRALVGCFREARERRQVFVVTHNPNLAVVCDADQIVVASMSTGNTQRIEYDSGSIEAPRIVRAIIDILEGTQPAFENRSVKYTLHRFGQVTT